MGPADSRALEMMQNNSVLYASGAITLALAKRIIFGGLTYLGLKFFRRNQGGSTKTTLLYLN